MTGKWKKSLTRDAEDLKFIGESDNTVASGIIVGLLYVLKNFCIGHGNYKATYNDLKG